MTMLVKMDEPRQMIGLEVAWEIDAKTRVCVLYVKNGIEHQSPWFTCRARAKQAQAIIQKRYGACVLYVD